MDKDRAARSGLTGPVRLLLGCAVMAALAACGGGGSGGAPAAPALPSPPAYGGVRVPLAQLPADCAQSTCAVFTRVSVDAAGEADFFWSEQVSGAPWRLAAANLAAGASSLAGSGTLVSGVGIPGAPTSFEVRPIAPRRAIVWQYDAAAAEPLQSRLIDFAATGAPTASPPATVPETLAHGFDNIFLSPDLVQDNAGTLYVVSGTLAAGRVVPLGGGVDLHVVPAPASPLATTDQVAVLADPQSPLPRALWAVAGRFTADSPRQVTVADLRLPDGALLPASNVDTPTVALEGNLTGCAGKPLLVLRASGTAPTRRAVAWTSFSASGSGCDLFVNGEKVNGSRRVSQYEVSVGSTEIVAVWEEFDTAGSNLLWSRRPTTSGGTWSPRAPVAPGFITPTDAQFTSGLAAGPGATLLAVWRNAQPQATGGFTGDGSWRISKYVDGSWSTVRVAESEDLRGLAINASGQAAVMTSRRACGTATCENLGAYRF